jgi:hypothetical protein
LPPWAIHPANSAGGIKSSLLYKVGEGVCGPFSEAEIKIIVQELFNPLLEYIYYILLRGVIAPFPNLTSLDVGTHKGLPLAVLHNETNQMLRAI